MLLCVILLLTSQIDVYMYKPMSTSMRNGLLGWFNHFMSFLGLRKTIMAFVVCFGRCLACLLGQNLLH